MLIDSKFGWNLIRYSARNREQYYSNGIMNENKIHIIRKIIETFVKENKADKKKSAFTTSQLIDVYEQVVEI